jgi:AraC family transcriptional regulator of adaptative response/methylated-DNA-[protein]-cysteine methyltransferase
VESNNDYARVELAISYIRRMSPAQPALADVAAHVGLSEFHFQRMFRRWAGITPKQFAQFLTIEHAKQLLHRSSNLMETAWSSGLSGSGRLHDLFVTVEALTPGEYRSEGEGVQITYGVHEGPFGDVLIATTPRGICGVYFVDSPTLRGAEAVLTLMRRQWPEAVFTRNDEAGAEYASRMFSAQNSAGHKPLPLLLRGTNFQVNVWKALLRIPSGSAVTYEQLARIAGNAEAIRATGTAVGRNPLSFVVPCHRVIRKTGEFGNYGGGIERKVAILAWESGRAEQGD